MLGGAALLSAAALTYGYVVKNHDVVDQWADDWQKDLKENAKEDFERMKQTGIIAGGLLAEAGDYVKEKIIGDRATIEQEHLADGIKAHGTQQKIDFNNYVLKYGSDNISNLVLETSSVNIAKGSYLVAAGMFVDDVELADKLKRDGLTITTKPLSPIYIDSYVDFYTVLYSSERPSGGWASKQYCKKFEKGSIYYTYSYSSNASGLTFEQVRDIYTQAIAGGVVKTEKVFEQVASDEYVDKALSDDYALAPSNAYEVSLSDEKVATISETVAGAQDDVKDIAWSDAMADVGAVAVAGDVALDFATAQDIAYADVIAGTRVKAESEPSKWQFPLTAFFRSAYLSTFTIC